ncbi:MAG TPA: hypothetical protein VM821_07990 [Abditibacteriaceae bacterium]|nr:hypothetical protein [Abditibacteriaceae bacterium]
MAIKDFFKRIETKLWLGEVVCDYGLIGDTLIGGRKEQIFLLLCKREGRMQIVLKITAVAIGAASVRYVYLDMDSTSRLKEIIEDIEKRNQTELTSSNAFSNTSL